MGLKIKSYFNLFASGIAAGAAGVSFGNGFEAAGVVMTAAAGLNVWLAFSNNSSDDVDLPSSVEVTPTPAEPNIE